MNKEQIETLIQYTDPHELAGLNEICRFSELKKSDVIKLLKDYKTLYTTDKGLWTIFGKGNRIANWTCLHVGSNRDIKSELHGILNLMVSRTEEIEKATIFHESVYELCTYMDKQSQKYRSMYDLCNEFVVYEIDVPTYLKDTDVEEYNTIEYAEVKFAYETKALYWNPAPKMNGNQEWEIYINKFKK
ncbi:MAG: hypothetical protein K2M78_16670 [Lachnospiraceae bacterium]|nr:hypothetical protein [Lachnospiraceae bacterium]